MKTNNKSRGTLENVKVNLKIKLSALWVTLMLCYIYADILSLFSPGAVEEIIAGKMGPFPVTQAALLSATILMIIPALMIFLSLILNPKANRWTNIIIGIVYTLVSIGNLVGETWIYYLVFGIIEIALTVLVVFYALKWPKQEA
ncbi:MAG: hypothetical protein KAR21_02920 [Spirochaetales bacterium]|nr:hypothetical protein [Spirochaetales bacterium]